MPPTKRPDEGDPKKKGSGEDDDDSKKQLGELSAAVKAQSEENAKLLKGMQGLAAVVKSQKDVIENIQKAFEDADEGKKPPPKTSSSSDQDVEALSRKEFLNDVIVPTIGTLLEDKLKGVTSRLDSVSSDFESKSIHDEVSKVRDTRPDFDSWKEEVARELKSNPNLSIDDAYLLARTRDPEKAQKMNEEVTEKQKEEAERRAAEQGAPFGGLRPGGGGEVEERDDMDEGEAADKAWEEVEESLGGKAAMEKALGMEGL